MNSQVSGLRNSRWLWIGMAVVVFAVVAVVLVMSLGGSDDEEFDSAASPSASATSTVPSAPPLDDARAKDLSAGLASGTDAGLRAIYDVNDQQPLDPAAVAAVAAVGTLTFDVSSFNDNMDGTASVTATSPATASAAATTWKVLLIARDGRWLISQTDQQ